MAGAAQPLSTLVVLRKAQSAAIEQR